MNIPAITSLHGASLFVCVRVSAKRAPAAAMANETAASGASKAMLTGRLSASIPVKCMLQIPVA
jgi:hypothetical protein